MSALQRLQEETQVEWARLQGAWQAARASWRDEVGDHFEQKRWQEWDAKVPAFIRLLDELDETLDHVAHETR